jgi:hypothetical protein
MALPFLFLLMGRVTFLLCPWSLIPMSAASHLLPKASISGIQPIFVDPQLYVPNGISYDFDSYAMAPMDSRNLLRDWDFLRREQGRVPKPGPSSQAHCPSLASGSTISSRNSSTRSTKSLRWPGSERPFEELEKDKGLDKQQCFVPEYSRTSRAIC